MIDARISETNAGEPEDRLVAAARSGDVESFGRLYERHKGAVFGFALSSMGRREDAEDVVQEAFCRAWRAIGGFRSESKFLTWLIRIAANICAEHARHNVKKRRMGVEVEFTGDEPDLSPIKPEEDLVRRQAARDALSALTVSNRMLVVLCDIQGFTPTEAARVLGCSVIGARVRLCRARKKLRELLEPCLKETD